MLGMGGFLDGVSNLINKFGELAERGETLRKSMGDAAGNSKPIRTSGEFSVRFGGLGGKDGDAVSVKPVNQESRSSTTTSTKNAKSTQSTTVPKQREAYVELFEEETHLLLLAEMPGVASDQVQLNFADKLLTIEGQSQTAHFKSQVELPRVFTMEQVSIAANNGVIEIRLSLN